MRRAVVRETGYTLVEILVTIAIMGIMMAIAVGTYSFGRNFDTLKSEMTRVVAVARNARIRDYNGIVSATRTCSTDSTKSCMTSAECTGVTPTCLATKLNLYPAGGYGVHIEKTSKVCSGAGNSDRFCTVNGDCPASSTCSITGTRSNYILFADFTADGHYNDGKIGNEFLEEYRVPKNFAFVFQNVAATQADIIFKSGAITVNEYNGSSWSIAAGTSYPLILDYTTACSSQKVPKKGQATIDYGTKQIYDTLLAC